MLNVKYADCHYTECHYTVCRCAQCRGAALTVFSYFFVQTLAEDEDLRGETPADSVAESELNESFIFQADKNGRLSHKTKG